MQCVKARTIRNNLFGLWTATVKSEYHCCCSSNNGVNSSSCSRSSTWSKSARNNLFVEPALWSEKDSCVCFWCCHTAWFCFRPPPTNTVVVFIVFTMVYHSAATMLLLLSSLVLTAMIRLEARDLCVPTSIVITNYFEGKRPPTCHYDMFYASVPSLFWDKMVLGSTYPALPPLFIALTLF